MIKRSRGFTLVELVIFIVIVSIAVVALLQVMSMNTAKSADPQLRKQALSIAEALMEEISSARFTFCDPVDANAETAANAAGCASVPEAVGPESGNARPFDNVNDYVSQYGVPQAITLTDVNGNAVPNLGAYSATVEIAQEALNGVPASESLRITIRVTYGSETLRIDGYRTRFAPNWVP